MNLHFRIATTADIADMHVVRMAVKENKLSNPGLVTRQHYLDMLEFRGCGWVCEAEGRIVGFAIADAQTSGIWALFVAPSFEGKGIGRRLHDLMIEWCRTRNLSQLWLTTSPRTRAEQFYLHMGWQKTGMTAEGEVKFERVL